MPLLYLVWGGGLILALLLYLSSRREATGFYGITETREVVVNTESAVEVKRILVVPGQAIREGDLLIDLANPELELRLNTISHELEKARVEKSLSAETLRAQIRQLEDERRTRVNQLGYELEQLQAQQALARDLTSSMPDARGAATNTRAVPYQLRIDALTTELGLTRESYKTRIEALQSLLASAQNPSQVQAELLSRELGMLRDAKTKLQVRAPLSGRIGAVNVKPGERIAPFTALLTLHGDAPPYVKGYIHEDAYSSVGLYQPVEVISLADSDNRVDGRVVGVGSRIVEFPSRMLLRPDMPLWGREVLVEIPAVNRFLLGEKVRVVVGSGGGAVEAPQPAPLGVRQAAAVPVAGPATGRQLFPFRSGPAVAGYPTIEASGLVWSEKLSRFLVISDETGKNQAALFLVDETGQADGLLPIRDAGRVDDMEAITELPDGSFCIVTSGSTTKGGRRKEKRSVLLRVGFRNGELHQTARLPLLALLEEAAGEGGDVRWAVYLRGAIAEGSINIEGAAVRGGALFLGFKRPFLGNKSVVLRIEDLEKVFARKKIPAGQVSLFAELALPDGGRGEQTGISDLLWHGNALYVLSYTPRVGGKPHRSGNLWRHTAADRRLELLAHLDGMQPEGIAWHPRRQAFAICLDNGKDTPSALFYQEVR